MNEMGLQKFCDKNDIRGLCNKPLTDSVNK